MNSHYNLRIIGRLQYRIVKFDDLLNVERIHILRYYRGRLLCDCYDFRRNPSCKHCEMKDMFLTQQKHNSGWMFEEETGRWWLNIDGQEKLYVEQETTFNSSSARTYSRSS